MEAKSSGFLGYTLLDSNLCWPRAPALAVPDENVPLGSPRIRRGDAPRAPSWSLALPWAFARAFRRRWESAAARLWLVLGLWSAAVLRFFVLVPYRLPHSALPAFPALALLVARVWDERVEGAPGALSVARAPRAGARAVRAGRRRARRGRRRLSAPAGGRAVEPRHRHAESDRAGPAGARRAVRGVDAALLLRRGHLRARRGRARGRGMAARRGAGCRGHPGGDDRLPAGGGGQRYDPVRARAVPPGPWRRRSSSGSGRGTSSCTRAPSRPVPRSSWSCPAPSASSTGSTRTWRAARRSRHARHLLGLAPIRAGLVGAGPPLPHLGGRPGAQRGAGPAPSGVHLIAEAGGGASTRILSIRGQKSDDGPVSDARTLPKVVVVMPGLQRGADAASDLRGAAERYGEPRHPGRRRLHRRDARRRPTARAGDLRPQPQLRVRRQPEDVLRARRCGRAPTSWSWCIPTTSTTRGWSRGSSSRSSRARPTWCSARGSRAARRSRRGCPGGSTSPTAS